MASIKPALVAFLNSDPGVSTIIDGRLSPEVGDSLPRSYPRLTYEQVKKEDDRTLGLSTDQPTVWIALTAWGQGQHGQADADNLTAAVRNARGPNPLGPRLKEFNSAWMPKRGDPAAVWVKGAWLDEEMSAAAQLGVDKAPKWIYQIVTVFAICFNENVYS